MVSELTKKSLFLGKKILLCLQLSKEDVIAIM